MGSPTGDWKDAATLFTSWRALHAEGKPRLRWESVPRSGAGNFAFEGEPVDREMLEAEHTRRPRSRVG
jgi:hypothetical protein